MHTHVTLDDFTPHSDMGEILKNILNACFSFKCQKRRGENWKLFWNMKEFMILFTPVLV